MTLSTDALLTAHQCLAFTNGLFLRWKAYYPLLPTLIRLLALQAICWPATHLTLTTLDEPQKTADMLDGDRDHYIWATSNLGVDARWKSGRAAEEDQGRTRAWMSSVAIGIGVGGGVGGIGAGSLKRWWDWREVGLKCALPAAMLYFIMSWALLLSREFVDYGVLSLILSHDGSMDVAGPYVRYRPSPPFQDSISRLRFGRERGRENQLYRGKTFSWHIIAPPTHRGGDNPPHETTKVQTQTNKQTNNHVKGNNHPMGGLTERKAGEARIRGESQGHEIHWDLCRKKDAGRRWGPNK
ncbi:hypothetical protein BS47DRAFT_1385540 [Hydnum rufescens UP504]|uniref:Uncharacterized protein n=1 Tax=Hydnum rufescens UP504 TaxID=1448309 RepID=A0A9P6DQE7_9AGAM|nr:hypothetical protein BS47DRAFT_1385540 [Hydnum rufescens UP504]